MVNYIKEYPNKDVRKKIDCKFWSKETDEKINFFIEEIKQNEFISRKQKKVCKILNYTDHLFILSSTVTECVFISDVASFVGISVVNEVLQQHNSDKNLRHCCGKLKVESINNKRKKKYDKIVLIAKTKLNTI